MSLFHTRSRHQSAGWHVVAADFLILSAAGAVGGTRQTRLPTSSATSPGLVDSKPYGAAQRSSVRTDKACQHIHWLSSGPPAGKGDEDHLITTPWSPVPRHMFSERAPPRNCSGKRFPNEKTRPSGATWLPPESTPGAAIPLLLERSNPWSSAVACQVAALLHTIRCTCALARGS